MPARVPQVEVEQVGCDHLVELVLPVELLHEPDQLVVDARARRHHERASGGQRVPEDEVLRRGDLPVVALLGLGAAVLVLGELRLLGERDPVDALQSLPLGVGPPERARGARHLGRLQVAGVRQVRPRAQVDHGPAAVKRDLGPGGEPFDQLGLELVLGEHPERLLARDDRALEPLLFGRDPLDRLVQDREVRVGQRAVPAHVAVVVEPLGDRGPDGQLDAERLLERLAQHVRGGVPEGVPALGRVELEELEGAGGLEGPGEVPVLAVDLWFAGKKNEEEKEEDEEEVEGEGAVGGG